MDPRVWDAVVPYLSNPIVLVIVCLAAAYMTVSKRLAQIAGPIGALARWWNSRRLEKVKRDRSLWFEQHARDREQDAAELDQLREDVGYLRREVIDMRRREQVRDRQAREHTQWDNEVVRKLLAAGIQVNDPPPLYPDLAPLHVPDPPEEEQS